MRLILQKTKELEIIQKTEKFFPINKLTLLLNRGTINLVRFIWQGIGSDLIIPVAINKEDLV